MDIFLGTVYSPGWGRLTNRDNKVRDKYQGLFRAVTLVGIDRDGTKGSL